MQSVLSFFPMWCISFKMKCPVEIRLGCEKIREPRMTPVLFSISVLIVYTSIKGCIDCNTYIRILQKHANGEKRVRRLPLSNAVSQSRHVLTNAQLRKCSGDRGFIGVLRRRISSIRSLSLSRCSKNLAIVSGPVYTNISWLLNSGNADTVKHDTPDGT